MTPRLSLFALLLMLAVPAAAKATLASPTPSCPPDRPATVVKAVSPDVPRSLRDVNFRSLVVIVNVAVDASGNVQSLTIRQSSGYVEMDKAALRAAQQSTYAPAIVDCVPAAGSYAFRVQVNQ